MDALSRLNSIRATDHPPCKLRGEIPAHVQPAWLSDAVRESVHHERGTAKAIAAALGVREQHVTDLADPLRRVALKAREIPGIVQASGSFAVLDALEAQVGRAAIVLPVVTPDQHAQVVTQTASVVSEFGEALTRVSGAIADGRVSPTEQQQIVREIQDVYRALAALQAIVTARAA